MESRNNENYFKLLKVHSNVLDFAIIRLDASSEHIALDARDSIKVIYKNYNNII